MIGCARAKDFIPYRAYDMAALKMRGAHAKRNFEEDDFMGDTFYEVILVCLSAYYQPLTLPVIAGHGLPMIAGWGCPLGGPASN